MPPTTCLIVTSPLAFGHDPDIGLLSVVATGETQQQKTHGGIEVPAFSMSTILYLTPETARQFLSDLPALEKLLEQASKGPTKPDFLQ